MENAPKKKGISPIFVIVLVIGLFLIIRHFVLKPLADANGNKNTVNDPPSPTPGRTSTEPANAPVTNASTAANNKINEYKSPLMKSDRIQWMQNGYNRYARNKQKYGPGQGKTGSVTEWVIIPEDGIFGEATHKAVKRVMSNTYKASWEQFKTRLKQVNDINFPGHSIY